MQSQMDSKTNGSKNLPKVQVGLVEYAETEEEIKKQKQREYMKAYNAQNRERLREQKRIYRETHREEIRASERRTYRKYRNEVIAYQKQYYEKNREKISRCRRKYNQAKHKEYREAVLRVYGSVCKCCGETETQFLSIDHIDNGHGNPADRSHGPIYRILCQKKFPPGYQILCHTCNFAKGRYGTCPHQLLKTPIDLFLEVR